MTNEGLFFCNISYTFHLEFHIVTFIYFFKLYNHLLNTTIISLWMKITEILSQILRKASPEKSNDSVFLLPPAPHSSDGVIGLHFPGLKDPKIISVSGAGDW